MKVLVTAAPTYGHLFPLLPLCWALRSAGHEALAALPGQFCNVAAASGLMVSRIGETDPFYRQGGAAAQHPPAKWGARLDDSGHSRQVLAVIDHVLDTYLPISETNAEGVVRIARAWQPDLVLHSPWDYTGPIAAAQLGIPRVSHGWGVALPKEIAPAEREALRPLLARMGLPHDLPEPAFHIDICPPSLQFLEVPERNTHMRYVPYNGSAPVEPWLLEPPRRTRVCVSVGSVPIEEGHANLLVNVVQALSSMDLEAVVLTGGVKLNLATSPANVMLVERNIPLSHVLPSCDMVIHHGGSGSTMTSTVMGLPQLAIPQMCDQFRHAERVAAAQVGLTLTSVTPGADEIHAAALEVLASPLYRQRARLLQAENLDQPLPMRIVARLEALVRQRTPALAPA